MHLFNPNEFSDDKFYTTIQVTVFGTIIAICMLTDQNDASHCYEVFDEVCLYMLFFFNFFFTGRQLAKCSSFAHMSMTSVQSGFSRLSSY